jgi:hypothetical protein
MSDDVRQAWLTRLYSAKASHEATRVHAVCCLFEELLSAYASASAELDSVKMALNRAIKDRDGYEADCAVLRSALVDEMWKESP